LTAAAAAGRFASDCPVGRRCQSIAACVLQSSCSSGCCHSAANGIWQQCGQCHIDSLLCQLNTLIALCGVSALAQPLVELFLLHDLQWHLCLCVKAKWVAVLSSEYPTMAYRASIKNPFGRGALINLLRQFGKVSC